MKINQTKLKLNYLTLIFVGFSGASFGAEGLKLPQPGLTLVRIMLETWNLVCKYK